MLNTDSIQEDMSNLQARIPTWLHRQLKANAALRGKSLVDYLVPLLEKAASSDKEAPDVAWPS